MIWQLEKSKIDSNLFDRAAPDVVRNIKPAFAEASAGNVGQTGFEPATPTSRT